MFRRALGGLTVAVLAVVMLGARDPNRRFEKLGHEMICACGCGQVLLECNHVSCPSSGPMIGELHDQLDGTAPGSLGPSATDASILNVFVAKYGPTVLASPIRGGFDDVAWIAPITVFLVGIFGTALVVRLWVRRRHALHPAVPSALPVDDTLRDRIRRETEY